jgi:hypothetical protein
MNAVRAVLVRAVLLAAFLLLVLEIAGIPGRATP